MEFISTLFIMWIWKNKLYLRPDFFLLPWLFLLQGQFPLWQFLLAAAAHEAGHLFCLQLFRVPVKSICLTAFGAEIHASLLSLSSSQAALWVFPENP